MLHWRQVLPDAIKLRTNADVLHDVHLLLARLRSLNLGLSLSGNDETSKGVDEC